MTTSSTGAVGSAIAGPDSWPQPAPTTRFRRRSSAVALMLAPWGFVVINAMYAWMTRNGGDDSTGAHALALFGAHPQQLRLIASLGMLACLLLVPGLLAAMKVLRRDAARLSLVAGVLMIAGYICYLPILSSNFFVLAMVQRGGPMADYAAVIDRGSADPGGLWVFILFGLGNLIGTILLGIALLRSSVVPRWAGWAVMAWPPLHIAGLVLGSEWFEVAGGILQGLGLVMVARAVLRTPDSTWDPQPAL
jgi:hypothetical protein